MLIDGRILTESHPVSDIATVSESFAEPVKIAIFLFGSAPQSAMGPADAEPETPSAPRRDANPDGRRLITDIPDAPLPWTAGGAEEITFPGVSLEEVPAVARSALKRMHQNIGHTKAAPDLLGGRTGHLDRTPHLRHSLRFLFLLLDSSCYRYA